MSDLVGTCPKDFWEEWILEGDAAGDPETGEEWGWYTSHPRATTIKPGDRFYVVAWGRLRGYSIVTRVENNSFKGGGWCIGRRGGAVACTIEKPIPGFRGLLCPWWSRDEEVSFPNWKTEGVNVYPERKPQAEKTKPKSEILTDIFSDVRP